MIRLMYVAPEKEDEEEGRFSLRTDGLSNQKFVALTMTHLIVCIWYTLDEEGRKTLGKDVLSEEFVKFLSENEEFVKFLSENEKDIEEVKADAE